MTQRNNFPMAVPLLPEGIPHNAAPAVLLEPALEASRATGSPLTFTLMAVLGALAICLQDKIKLKRPDGGVVPAALACLGIGKSGERKSTALNIICKPLYEFADGEGLLKLQIVGDSSATAMLDAIQSGSVGIVTDEAWSFLNKDARALQRVLLHGTEGGMIRSIRRGKVANIRATISTVGMIQPDTLLRCLMEDEGMLRTMGILPRCAIFWPPSQIGFRTVGAEVELKEVSKLHSLLWDLLRLDIPVDAPILECGKGATDLWMNYARDVEVAQRPGRELAPVADFASRSSDLAARLALIYHGAQRYDGPIRVDTMGQAVTMATFLLQQASQLFGEAGLMSEARKDAESLEKYLNRRYGQGGFWVKSNDVRRWCKLRTANRFHAAVDILVADEFLTVQDYLGTEFLRRAPTFFSM